MLWGENNSVQQILSFFEKENEKARDHELWLFQNDDVSPANIYTKVQCNIQIQPAPQTAVSSSPAQAEHLDNIPPPNTDSVPCTFRNKSFQQTDLTPNTTAVMTES